MQQRLEVDRLRLGLYVAQLDRPWVGTPFLFQGFLIRNEQELSQLRECCEYVDVDVERSEAAPEPEPAKLAPPPPLLRESAPALAFKPPTDLGSFQADVRAASRARAGARQLLDQVMADARLGRSVAGRDARAVVGDLTASVARNAAAALWLTNLKRKDEYTSLHSLNVCVLSIAFAFHLGLPREQIEVIGLGALLHDVGKMRTPQEVLNKPGALTDAEFDLIRRHPMDGYDIVRAGGDVPPEALEIIRHHHERVDGRGYPDGLAGEALGLHVLITAIADVYDAVTSDRAYHAALPAHEGLKVLYAMTPTAFPRELVEAFIRCIGIYPVGSLVRLNNGAMGVVVATDPKRRLKPMVLLIKDPAGRPLLPRRLLDLSQFAEREGWDKWSIVGVLDAAEHGIDLAAVALEQAAASAAG